MCCLLVTSLACLTSLDLQVDSSWGNKGSVLLQQWKIEPWHDAGTFNYLSWQIKQLSSFMCRGSFFKCLILISSCNPSLTAVLYPHWNHAESPVSAPFSHPRPGFVSGDREMFPRPSGSSSSRARSVLQQPRASWPSRRWMNSSSSCPSSPRRMTSRVFCSRSVAGEGRNQSLKVCTNTEWFCTSWRRWKINPEPPRLNSITICKLLLVVWLRYLDSSGEHLWLLLMPDNFIPACQDTSVKQVICNNALMVFSC